jgi:hypothetical protein
MEVGRLDEALEADEAEFFELHFWSRKAPAAAGASPSRVPAAVGGDAESLKSPIWRDFAGI